MTIVLHVGGAMSALQPASLWTRPAQVTDVGAAHRDGPGAPDRGLVAVHVIGGGPVAVRGRQEGAVECPIVARSHSSACAAGRARRHRRRTLRSSQQPTPVVLHSRDDWLTITSPRAGGSADRRESQVQVGQATKDEGRLVGVPAVIRRTMEVFVGGDVGHSGQDSLQRYAPLDSRQRARRDRNARRGRRRPARGRSCGPAGTRTDTRSDRDPGSRLRARSSRRCPPECRPPPAWSSAAPTGTRS